MGLKRCRNKTALLLSLVVAGLSTIAGEAGSISTRGLAAASNEERGGNIRRRTGHRSQSSSSHYKTTQHGSRHLRRTEVSDESTSETRQYLSSFTTKPKNIFERAPSAGDTVATSSATESPNAVNDQEKTVTESDNGNSVIANDSATETSEEPTNAPSESPVKAPEEPTNAQSESPVQAITDDGDAANDQEKTVTESNNGNSVIANDSATETSEEPTNAQSESPLQEPEEPTNAPTGSAVQAITGDGDRVVSAGNRTNVLKSVNIAPGAGSSSERSIFGDNSSENTAASSTTGEATQEQGGVYGIFDEKPRVKSPESSAVKGTKAHPMLGKMRPHGSKKKMDKLSMKRKGKGKRGKGKQDSSKRPLPKSLPPTPVVAPTPQPVAPTRSPTTMPPTTSRPSRAPTSFAPTSFATTTAAPSAPIQTPPPTPPPTLAPTTTPTTVPTLSGTNSPTPGLVMTTAPSAEPTIAPLSTIEPTLESTNVPTAGVITTEAPSPEVSMSPSLMPTTPPTSLMPTNLPTSSPTTSSNPSVGPSLFPSTVPSLMPTQCPEGAITNFTLVNATSNLDLQELLTGSIIDLARVGRLLNVRADTSGTIAAVQFDLNGDFVTEETRPPYAIGSNMPQGDYMAYPPIAVPGDYTITARALCGTGQILDTQTVAFSVEN